MISNQQCRPYDSRFLQFASTEDQENIYRVYGEAGSIVNEAARRLDKDPSRVSQVVRLIQERAEVQFGKMEWDDDIKEIQIKPLNILLMDIETYPAKGYLWSFYNQNIAHNQIEEYGGMLSFAAKWLGCDEIIYEENRAKSGKHRKSSKDITKKLIDLYDQADIVIGHNGRAFDVKTVMGLCAISGIQPPTPFKIVDTFLSAKKHFKFPRNSLEFLLEHFQVGRKYQHKKYPGMELWRACMDGVDDAWEEMRTYNIVDVADLEKLYLKMRPFITDHPNIGVLQEDCRPLCPKCGSGELGKPRRKHFATTSTGKYPLFVCRNCGGYCRARKSVYDKERGKSLTVNAV